MGELFQELKRRNIFRVGAAYVVLSWLILQVGALFASSLELPGVVMRVLIFFLVIGFPLILLFAWAFELTPEGIKRTKEVQTAQSVTDATGKKLNVLTSALLAAVIALLLAERFIPTANDNPLPAEPSAIAELGERSYESIAVLPFVNMSDDKQQEYFSDGISEELLNLLAKTKGLRVAARTSSFAYKGQNQNIRKIGEDLDVETVLEGSVRKGGAKLRVTAQLIDVETGYHLWSETYDREDKDIFAIQDEISAHIVNALKVHFGGEQVDAPQQSYQPSLIAYDYYLKGQEALKKRTKANIEEALEFFTKAIEADPKYAPAYALKSDAYLLLSDRPGAYGDIPVKYAIEFAKPLVDLALELDPDLPEAHNSRGFLLHTDDKDEEALDAYDRAIDLSPSFALAHMWRSQLIDDMRGSVAGLPYLETAYKLDPMSPLLIQNLANRLINARQFDRARYLLQKLEEVAPEKKSRIAFVHARLLHSQGEWAEAYLRLLADYENMSVVRNNMRGLLFDLRNEVEYFKYADELPIFWYYFNLEQWDKAEEQLLAQSEEMRATQFGYFLQFMLAMGREDYPAARVAVEKGDFDLSDDGPLFVANPGDSAAPELALMFRETGDPEEAERLLSLTEALLQKGREDGFEFLTHISTAQVYILRGQDELAIEELRKDGALKRLDWSDRNIMIIRTLKGNPKFEALFDEVLAWTNQERVKLGWEPMTRDEFYPEEAK